MRHEWRGGIGCCLVPCTTPAHACQRSSESAAATWCSKPAAVHLHGKGRKQRCVPLWRPTAALVRRWQRSLGATAQDGFLLPNRIGAKLIRAKVTQRLDLAVAAAWRHLPSLAGRSISSHVIRHTTAMHLLQSGIDITSSRFGWGMKVPRPRTCMWRSIFP